MNLWTYTVREIQRRPMRTLLTTLGITLGLLTVVATRLTIHTVHAAYRNLFDSIAGRPSLEVIASGQGGFDGGFAPILTSIPGVKAVIPLIQGTVAVEGKGGSVPTPLVGIDPAGAVAAPAWAWRAGQAFPDRDSGLLDVGLARALGLKAGDPIHLWAPTGPAEVRLSGVLKPRGPAAAMGGVLVVPLARARQLFALPNRINIIQVVLMDDADPGRVQAEVARHLPPGLTVQLPGKRTELAWTTLLSMEQGLACLSIVAAITAGFVILNTFLLNLGERRRQLALLRSLGATRVQVARLLLRETLVIGMAGTLSGGVGGVVFAWGLLRIMERFLGVPLPGLKLDREPFVLALLLGPGAALAVACLPAWSAARQAPLEELLPQRSRQASQRLPPIAWAGLLLLTAGATLEIGLCRGWFSAAAGQTIQVPALALFLTGSVLALPLLIGTLLRLAIVLPLGLVGRLACLQLVRHRIRTGLTAAILFLALAVAIGFGQTIRGVVRDLRHWYRQTIVADFLVRGRMPDTTLLLAPALPETLAGEIRQTDGVAAVDKISFLPALANDQPVLVLARTFSPRQPLPLDLREGKAAEVLKGLLQGEVVLGTGLAQRLRLHRGDQVTLATAHGQKSLRIAGTATEFASGGSAMYLEWRTAQDLLDVPGVHVFLVRANPGTSQVLAPALQAFCDQHHLLLQSNAELRGRIDLLAARVTGILWALMALAFVVASLGIINTLQMNVYQQARAFGVLRALGLKRRQVCQVVLAQALLLGNMIWLPGACMGVALAYLISRSSASWAGPPLVFEIDWPLLGGCCGLALVIALLAALVPAYQTARLPVMRALHQS